MPVSPDYSSLLASYSSGRFQGLWPAQSHVLTTYADSYENVSDLAIELPTGAGKTLIALLIAEAWRRHDRKVAVLTANKTLARQMLQEAQTLGMDAVLMEGRGEDIPIRARRGYQRATHVAIMNYWVYFNQNPIIDPADLLIMDDAHLAEHCLHSLYSVEITRQKHGSLFRALGVELLSRFPEYSVLADALSDDAGASTAPELLSFLDQAAVSTRLRDMIDASPLLAGDTDLRFRWDRLRSRLTEASIYLGVSSIWVRPYIYPLIANPYYYEAVQRIYMSATIGDSTDLARRLGTKRITKIPVPPEYAESTLGRRLIAMNRTDDADIPARLGQAIHAALQIRPKSVWLCSSESEANKLRDVVSAWLAEHGFVGHPTWLLTSLGDEIDQFKSAERGHLFVAGRFDGMDFTQDQCRLVVVATVPRAINLQEEFISAYLRDAGFMRRRLNQRIVQALGRCNRTPDDFALYILGDRRFVTHFGRESNREGLPRNMVAEIDMAQDMAEIPEDKFALKILKFLSEVFDEYDAEFTDYLQSVPPAALNQLEADTSDEEIQAWTALYQHQDYVRAAKHFERSLELLAASKKKEIMAFHRWSLAKAIYLQGLHGEPGAEERALSILEDAIGQGGYSSWFNRMRASLNRARYSAALQAEVGRGDYAATLLMQFDDELEQLGIRGDRFDRWATRISEQLQADSHAAFQEGLEAIGKVLGYTAQRPRHGASTDVRWRGVFGNVREVVTFEAKIEHHPAGRIVASDVGQALLQQTRAESEYGSLGYTVRGTIVTHLADIAPDAESAAGSIRIVTKDATFKLWERVRRVMSLYRSRWSLDDLAARVAAADAIRAKLPPTGWLTRTLDVDRRFISADDLLAEWPA